MASDMKTLRLTREAGNSVLSRVLRHGIAMNQTTASRQHPKTDSMESIRAASRWTVRRRSSPPEGSGRWSKRHSLGREAVGRELERNVGIGRDDVEMLARTGQAGQDRSREIQSREPRVVRTHDEPRARRGMRPREHCIACLPILHPVSRGGGIDRTLSRRVQRVMRAHGAGALPARLGPGPGRPSAARLPR